MATEIVSDVGSTDTSVPMLELDEAIYGWRSLCLGLLDFSNPDCYSGTGPVGIGTQAKSLTSDQSVGTAVTAWGAVLNGMLPFTAGGGNRFTLPNTFKLTAAVRHFLAVTWVKLPAGGYTSGSGNHYYLLAGEAVSSVNAQWGFQLTTNASGVPTQLTALVPGSASGSSDIYIATGAALNALCDGNVHQLAVEWDGSAATTLTKRLLIDGVVVASSTVAYDNSNIIQPAQLPCLGYPGQVYNTDFIAGMAVGRPSLWNLTGSSVLATDILVRDREAAAGYVS